MQQHTYTTGLMLWLVCIIASCTNEIENKTTFSGAEHEVKLITIDPGHFHAALVQKNMYHQVSPKVHVYAPDGPDVQDHLNRINGFNTRSDDPTRWEEIVYTGPDFLEKMLLDKPGNVVVTSGNNQKKIDYIQSAVKAGIHVLADKPICIDIDGFKELLTTFQTAAKNKVLLYDIMTERSEITTILQKELISIPEVFGEMEKGSQDRPAVVKESVHHFLKTVAGNPIKRPAWFFDATQQGEGIVDVATHLVDLIQWACFPGQILDYQTDIEVHGAKRWPTLLSDTQFKTVTRLNEFPDYLQLQVKEGTLPVFCNGEIHYTIKGVHSRVAVEWKYQAPEGDGDTHFSIIRGTKSNIIIKQGREQNYRPELYVEPIDASEKEILFDHLKDAIHQLQKKYPGITLHDNRGHWQILIPDELRIGHEAHFKQVTERFLQYLIDGRLPEWEVPNMITKYYITTKALEIANESSN